MKFILASASKSRLVTLQKAGFRPEVVVSNVDEAALVEENNLVDPKQMVLTLAEHKAKCVAALPVAEDSIVLGCDSVFEIFGKVYGKPGNMLVAEERLKLLNGNCGVLYSGHYLVDNRRGKSSLGFGSVGFAEVGFVKMLDSEVEAYLRTRESLHVAGGFTLEGFGGSFVEYVVGDVHAIVGVSLIQFRKLLAQCGIMVSQLWDVNI